MQSSTKSITNNLGYLCTGAVCSQGMGDKTALRWISANLEAVDYSFNGLDVSSNRIANILVGLGMKPGDRVAVYLPKSPEVFFCLIGIIKAVGIACPLFSNFGEDALLDRLSDSETSILITRKSLLKKILPIRIKLPVLKKIILIDTGEHLEPDVFSLQVLQSSASDQFETPQTSPDTPALLHYTSGSTGKPKGVLHLHRSSEMIAQTGREVLGIQPDDIYWCTADQAWITGTSYGVFAPWMLGATQIHYGGPFNADTWCHILEKFKVNIWYTAPTALRMMIQQEEIVQRSYDYSHLRHIFSVGEPLNPQIIQWGQRFFNRDIHDTWFQTETGAIMIANRPGLLIKQGSMGKPVRGIHAWVISEDGNTCPVNEQGYLCLTPGWTSMFQTYWNNDSAYRSKFKNNCYYSGDMAYQDGEGYFWFIGRTDDVINTAGHLVSPFEVESALLELAEVIDVGVIAVPDELLFEAVVAYIRLVAGTEWTKDLELKMKRYISNRVSTTACPREIIPVETIPKNKSGKIMRRLLRAWYTGQDAGDISTMEEG